MFLKVFVVLLGALVLYAICRPGREGLDAEYNKDEAGSVLALAKKNETNIAELKTSMDTLLKMNEQVASIQQACDANTQNISTLVTSCK